MALGDLLTEGLKALGGSLTSVINGTNPLSQLQIGNFVGANIPATPIVSTRNYFQRALNSWVATPMLQSQWIMVIESFPPALASSVIRNLERTAGSSRAFDIDIAKGVLGSFLFQKTIGCLFCKAFEMPEETYSVSNATVKNNRGFIPGIISGDRSGYAEKQLSIDFLDTSYSFVETLIRPWVMLASHFGYVTRSNPNLKITTNIYLLAYSRSYQNLSQIPSKVFRFYNCAPTQVAPKRYEYDEPESTGTYTAKFTFTNYTVENGLYLPLPQLLNIINS